MSVFEAVGLVLFVALALTGLGGFWLWLRRESPTTWAVMVARQDRQGDKIALLEWEMDAMREERSADRGVIRALRADLETWKDYARALAAQVRELGGHPPPEPRAVEPPREMTLVQRITAQFSRSELDGLIMDAGYIPDEIAGETIDERARALVAHAARRGQYPALVELCRRARPNGGF